MRSVFDNCSPGQYEYYRNYDDLEASYQICCYLFAYSILLGCLITVVNVFMFYLLDALPPRPFPM